MCVQGDRLEANVQGLHPWPGRLWCRCLGLKSCPGGVGGELRRAGFAKGGFISPSDELPEETSEVLQWEEAVAVLESASDLALATEI